MSGGAHLVELASGIDALYLSGRGEIAKSLLTRLAQGRAAAEELRCCCRSSSVEWSSPLLRMALGVIASAWFMRTGGSGWAPLRSCRPSVSSRWPSSCTVSAPALHCRGSASCSKPSAKRWCSVSAASTCSATSKDWGLLGEDRHRFVCRARRCRTNEDAGVLTGFEFGHGPQRPSLPGSTTRRSRWRNTDRVT